MFVEKQFDDFLIVNDYNVTPIQAKQFLETKVIPYLRIEIQKCVEKNVTLNQHFKSIE